MNLLELDQLGQSFYSGLWTDKQRRHQYYSRIYADLFAQRQHQPTDLLEIGSAHGGSLLVWADWFTDVRVTGVDCHDNSAQGKFIPNMLAEPRSNIHNYLADAYSPNFYEKLGDFDIIIEDAAHTESQMRQCLEIYLTRVRPQGLLIIEDINPDLVDIPGLVDLAQGRPTELFDLREHTGTNDSVVLVVYN